MDTQEILGGAPSPGGKYPKIKAYEGPLPMGIRGIEFMTAIPGRPKGAHSDPVGEENEVNWQEGMPGVTRVPDNESPNPNRDYIKMKALIYSNTQIEQRKPLFSD